MKTVFLTKVGVHFSMHQNRNVILLLTNGVLFEVYSEHFLELVVITTNCRMR